MRNSPKAEYRPFYVRIPLAATYTYWPSFFRWGWLSCGIFLGRKLGHQRDSWRKQGKYSLAEFDVFPGVNMFYRGIHAVKLKALESANILMKPFGDCTCSCFYNFWRNFTSSRSRNPVVCMVMVEKFTGSCLPLEGESGAGTTSKILV